MTKPKVVIAIGQKYYDRMINPKAMKALEEFAEVVHHPGNDPATKEELMRLLPDADVCITSWEVAPLDADVIASAPKLKAMIHMGGSVKKMVSDAVWEKGIKVFSARPALAKDVAETALGLMIIGMKHIWPLAQHVREGGWRESPYWPSRELHRNNVGIIAASEVGRHVIEFLKPFEPNILLFDPFVSEEKAAEMGVKKVSLEELARESDVISLHAPSLPSTIRMVNAEILQMMKDDCILINTARGTLIDQPALIAELEKGRLFAFLDVTDPEPPELDSPLRKLPNVVVMPHLAGCIEDCSHLSTLAVEELRRFFSGESLINEVTVDILDRIG